MISKPNMFLIYNTDESIKGKTTNNNLTLFNTYSSFVKYTEERPCIVETLIVTNLDLPFTNTNIGDFLGRLNSPFLKVEEVLYLVGATVDIESVDTFLESQGLTNWKTFAGDVKDIKFIESIVSGEGRLSNVTNTMSVTYRVKLDEYTRYRELVGSETTADKAEYYLENIEPELTYKPEQIVTENIDQQVYYVVGDDSHERTTTVLSLAQYISLNGKVVIIEKDNDYHRLTDYVTKSGLKCDLVLIEELYQDFGEQMKKVNNSTSNIVVIGSKKRTKYSYNFIFDMILNSMNGKCTFIKECDYEETPYGCKYIVVTRPTVPDVFKTLNSLRYPVSEDCLFVATSMQNINPVGISNNEFNSLLSLVLATNISKTVLIRINGLTLKKGDAVNDLSGIIEHYVGRQDKRIYSHQD